MPRQKQLSQPSETWRGVPGYEGRYWVSNLGRVQAIRSGTILGVKFHRDGYAKVNLKKGRASRTFFVHALVAEVFLGPRPDGYVIHHRDGDVVNSAAKNLRYLSAKQARRLRRYFGHKGRATGVPNVYFHARGGFYARINVRGRNVRLGRFTDLESAIKAVVRFKKNLKREAGKAAPQIKQHLRRRKLVISANRAKNSRDQRALLKKRAKINVAKQNSVILQRLKPR